VMDDAGDLDLCIAKIIAEDPQYWPSVSQILAIWTS